MIDVATGIAKVLKIEGIDWVSTFPVCKVNNALGKEEIPTLLSEVGNMDPRIQIFPKLWI